MLLRVQSRPGSRLGRKEALAKTRRSKSSESSAS